MKNLNNLTRYYLCVIAVICFLLLFMVSFFLINNDTLSVALFILSVCTYLFGLSYLIEFVAREMRGR